MERWLNKLDSYLRIALSVCCGVLVLGVICYLIPHLAKNSTLDAAAATIQTVSDNQPSVGSTLEEQLRWYSPPYTAGLSEQLGKANSFLQTATNQLQQAKDAGSFDASIKLANDAIQSANDASILISQVQTKLVSNDVQRKQAIDRLDSVKKDLASGYIALAHASQRFSQEQDAWLTKYMGPLGDAIALAGKQVRVADDAATVASAYLPQFSDVGQKGHPANAMDHLDKAKAAIDQINTLAAKVTSELDYQTEAQTGAAPTIAQADTKVQLATTHMHAIADARGYALDKALALANSLYQHAATELAQAQLVMNSPVSAEGNKLDYAAAYEQAKQSVMHADGAFAEVDNQVALDDSARTKLGQYISVNAQARNAVHQASSDLQTLSEYHGRDAWSDVSNNVTSANNDVATAQKNSIDAQAALKDQRFADAEAKAQLSLDQLQTALTNAQAVSSLSSTLEDYRTNRWPYSRTNARTTIDGQTADIQSYGSYSSSAKGDYDGAVSLFTQAESEASSRYFRPATEYADQATSLASGTGSKARQAYDDYQAEQERQRRQAEEDRKRAEEQAQQQQQQQNWSSSDSGSSGGSSCCDSGGGSSGGDGGDWGGGDSGGDGGDW